MATDSELRDRIREMMCESDPDEVTVGSLYRKLEAAHGVDFSNKKAFVRREFAGFLMNYLQCDDEDDGDDSPAVNKRIKSESKEYDYKVGVVGEELAGVKGEEDVVKEQSKRKGTQNWRKRFARPKKLWRLSPPLAKILERLKKIDGRFARPKKLWRLSSPLAKFVGLAEENRWEVFKTVRSYICGNKLFKQNGDVFFDEKLRPIFGVETLKHYLIKVELYKQMEPIGDPNMKDYDSEDERLNAAELQEGLRRARIPVPISDALVEFFGTGEKEMTENAIVNRLLNYAGSKNLRVGWDNSTIICDKKLKKLFKVDCFNICHMPQHVIPHLLKRALDD
ncbi:hypothetical protein RHSIM_Rhsim12G0062400 [Rhododendron simsii]|uniref:Uncharacterized protein n=1 Tax=Rhododendron simsii TaxID=118357 RepID=A0A834G7K0_RHOSS|nr:hypothetical protein RHSIM_Rhsim12G0062400 [Rhododendron simsii]